MLSNACPSLKRTLMSFGATSAEMTGFTAFQLSTFNSQTSDCLDWIGSPLRSSAMWVDYGKTLVVGSNDQIVEQGGVSDES